VTEKPTPSNAELERFAYIVSHDLKEPLRAITGFSDLLQRRLGSGLDTDSRQYLDYIVGGARTLQAMIDGLLEYSRAGAAVDEPQQVDMDHVLSTLMTQLAPAVSAAKASIAVEPLPSVRGDSARLSRLFRELIDNALKFHGDHPAQVRIGAEDAGSQWLFSVSDQGIGIEPRQQQRIFEVFQRLHDRGKYDGIGIGLAVCRRIVESHGGRLWVESGDGRGARFLFTLPKGDAVSDIPAR
jgi:light-regulated signal transduction histidine kinase (bacteriophytochrome)